MAYLRSRTLVVLTLLQLCRAEISDTLPESWYSANVIHDGFQPKPLSEIFSTPPAFSSTNPIVVLPNSSPASNEIYFSTVAPPPVKTSIPESITDMFTKFDLRPSTISTPSPTTIPTLAPETLSTIKLQTQPQGPQSQIQEMQSPLPQFSQQPELSSQSQITQQSLTPSTPLLHPEPSQITVTIPQPVSQRTTLSIPQLVPRQTTVSIPQPVPRQTSASISQTVPEQPRTLPQNPLRFDLSPLADIMQRQRDSSKAITSQQTQTPNENPPNYILIYQQAPQYLQGEGMASSQAVPQITTLSPPISTTDQPRSSLLARTVPSTIISSTPPTSQTITSSSRPVQRSTASILSPTISPLSTRTDLPTRSISFRPVNADGLRPLSPNCNITNLPSVVPFETERYPLKIRVIAPRGSITNVMIKPLTTTTRKPTTTRTRKPKKNTYDSCVSGCKGNRKPICGRPLSSTVIDTNTLKGFPSVCHMACHNSYRKEAYEQLLEGRCSLLRTRIRTVDSKTKLKRDELNKAQYSVDNSEPLTVVEFSGALQS